MKRRRPFTGCKADIFVVVVVVAVVVVIVILFQFEYINIAPTRIFSYKKLNSQIAKKLRNSSTGKIRLKKLFVLIKGILDMFSFYFH